MNTSATASPVSTLSRREEEVLALMAEGRTNAGIARELVLSCGAIEKHVANIFAKLGLPASPYDHRRVLAVLTYVRAGGTDPLRRPLSEPAPQSGTDPLRRPLSEPAPQSGTDPLRRPLSDRAPQSGTDPLRRPLSDHAPQGGGTDTRYAAVPMRPVFHDARPVATDPLRHVPGHRVPS